MEHTIVFRRRRIDWKDCLSPTALQTEPGFLMERPSQQRPRSLRHLRPEGMYGHLRAHLGPRSCGPLRTLEASLPMVWSGTALHLWALGNLFMEELVPP